MKKKISFILLALFVPLFLQANDCNNCSCDVTSHSFFWVRPQFDVGSPEYLSLSKYQRWQNDHTTHGASYQIVPFGGSSTKSGKIGKFFMPFCSNETLVNGNISFANNALFPQNFNIFSIKFSSFIAGKYGLPNLADAFTGSIEVNPKQKVAGFGFVYKHQATFGDRLYFWSVSAPIIQVKNSMHLEEIITNDSVYTVPPIAETTTNLNSPLTSMTAALQQSGWYYGKINNKYHKKTGLGFIQIESGISFNCYHDFIIDPFVGITIPTGNTPSAEFVFDPVIGNGGHFGFLWGVSTELLLWQNKCATWDINFNTDIVMQYLLPHAQKRSFDLKNKPWSRYIEIYASFAQAQVAFGFPGFTGIFLNSPGINLLTQDVMVRPGFNLALNLALTLNQTKNDHGFNGEVGYNFYAKQPECLSLKQPFNTQGAAIKDHLGMGLTNPVRDITQNQLLNEASVLNTIVNATTPVLTVYDRAIIEENDLNFASAAHPAILSQTVYAVFGYHWDKSCVPTISGIGASYEFSNANTALNRWLIWGKLGISF